MQETRDNLEKHAIAVIARAMRNISFYSIDHPMVQDNATDAFTAVSRLLEDASEFVLKVVDGELVINNRPLFESGEGTANLVGACLRRDIESITFRRGLFASEMTSLIDVLSCDPPTIDQYNGASEYLISLGVSHVVIEKLHLELAQREFRPLDELTRECYASAIDVLRTATRQAIAGTPPEVEPVRQIIGEMIDIISQEQSMMLGLVAVKGRDEYTFTHALHIAILSLELGYSLGLQRHELQELGICALLHDIGKINVPLSILRKPTALEPDEFRIVQQHPLHGALLLSRQPQVPPLAPVVAFEHHRHYNGSGYPHLPHPRPLCLYTLIVGPADVYDALTTDRPYRSALTPQQAVTEMQCQVAQFEPRILTRFIQMLGAYPPGSLVRLSDGRRAVVTRVDPRMPFSPWVRTVALEEIPRLEDLEMQIQDTHADGTAADISVDILLDPATERLDMYSLLGGTRFYTG